MYKKSRISKIVDLILSLVRATFSFWKYLFKWGMLFGLVAAFNQSWGKLDEELRPQLIEEKASERNSIVSKILSCFWFILLVFSILFTILKISQISPLMNLLGFIVRFELMILTAYSMWVVYLNQTDFKSDGIYQLAIILMVKNWMRSGLLIISNVSLFLISILNPVLFIFFVPGFYTYLAQKIMNPIRQDVKRGYQLND